MKKTSKDPTLTLLRCYIHMGWPNDHRMFPQELHTFSNYREDLSMENGLITKGARLLIPSTLRKKVLEQIRDGHLGIEKVHAQSKRLCILARHIQWHLRNWKNVEFVKQVPRQLNQLEMWVTHLLMHGTLWALTCSIGTKLTAWWLEITSLNTWLWGDFLTVPHTLWSRN